jgi:hypothetical protein
MMDVLCLWIDLLAGVIMLMIAPGAVTWALS